VLLLVLALSALGGGGGSHPAGSSAASSTEAVSAAQGSRPHARRAASRASDPAGIVVAVLNGTATAGLAHHLASDLQQSGYTRAAASAAVPAGSHPTTVVEYASGHHADALGVARALDVARVQPLEGVVAQLVGSAGVVVLAGADQAALMGGGGTQGHGEPAAGTGSGSASTGQ
jgi:hypothetical protein